MRTRTIPEHRHTLPIVALTADAGAFFDPDSGIYVIGNAILHSDEVPVRTFPKDHRWWKYPGNFQLRGEEWERAVHVEAMDGNGSPTWHGDARVRIHGNNTRGFPQHALRITFQEPCTHAWTTGTAGQESVILRAAGNDQANSFMRDLVQHRMCENLPFVTSSGRSVVVYLNGAYWGVHHVRDRVDDHELARRYGGAAKRYAVLEDRLKLYKGDETDVRHFSRFLTWSERWDASKPAFVDSVSHYLDVDGFLSYMAAQLILGNMDWPDQNVRYWRWTGAKDSLPGVHDGRWRMMMGDSDMGLGYSAPVTIDPFAHVEGHNGPIARSYKALMRSVVLRDRMRAEVERLLAGPLSTAGMLAAIDEAHGQLAHEMKDHVARWRKPTTVADWERNVEVLRTFARDRPAAMRKYAVAHLSAH
ncbi:MAG: CotH kinase family protein [Flavobacteriales bacterium]|nr:CotH kinase family protein [Flavobacteriales bacterium]